VVVKLGGKALSEGERAKQLAEKINFELKDGKKVVVIVSAVGDTTDRLLDYSAKACSGEISPKDLDEILAMGERTSARIFTAALKARGVNAKFLDPLNGDWPIITDNNFGNANPIEDRCTSRIRSKIEKMFSENITPVVPGFIGKTKQGEITTLGRGGSDITAFLVGKAIGASEVILVTDVKGILSADPKIVSNSHRIEEISLEKLMNLCDMGEKFLHRKALKFLDGSFKVKITSYEYERLGDEGTVIKGSASKNDASERNVFLAALTIVANTPLAMPEICSAVLDAIIRNGVQVLILSADNDALVLYVNDKDAHKVTEILHSEVLLKGRSKNLSIALKRGIAWTKVSGVEKEKIYDGIIALKTRQERLFGVLTVASNIHFFTENQPLHVR
jgi:aspartate kinase